MTGVPALPDSDTWPDNDPRPLDGDESPQDSDDEWQVGSDDVDFEDSGRIRCRRKLFRRSRFRGVSPTRRSRRCWRVRIIHNRVRRLVGYFSDEEDAARAYDKAAIDARGPAAITNFPTEQSAAAVAEAAVAEEEDRAAAGVAASGGATAAAAAADQEAELEDEMWGDDEQRMEQDEPAPPPPPPQQQAAAAWQLPHCIGVRERNGRWQANVYSRQQSRNVSLGTFASLEEAARAYDLAIIRMRGFEAAVTNFPKQQYAKGSGGSDGDDEDAEEEEEEVVEEEEEEEEEAGLGGWDAAVGDGGAAAVGATAGDYSVGPHRRAGKRPAGASTDGDALLAAVPATPQLQTTRRAAKAPRTQLSHAAAASLRAVGQKAAAAGGDAALGEAVGSGSSGSSGGSGDAFVAACCAVLVLLPRQLDELRLQTLAELLGPKLSHHVVTSLEVLGLAATTAGCSSVSDALLLWQGGNKDDVAACGSFGGGRHAVCAAVYCLSLRLTRAARQHEALTHKTAAALLDAVSSSCSVPGGVCQQIARLLSELLD